MYKNKKIAVVIPAYNEEKLIAKTITTLPEYIDYIITVDDCSNDLTRTIVEDLQSKNPKIQLITHDFNKGVGGSIASGYRYARDKNIDVAVVMAGDAQMDPGDLPNILEPVVDGLADYSKGNRLFTGEAYKIIPKVRYFGNAMLSFFTKIASGYWHVADSQTGYTAINLKALKLINWSKMYKRYGQPNDLLVRLNIFNLKVVDIPVKPIYNIGEKSGIKLSKVMFTIPWLLIKLFLWRMKEKYVIRNFHPLVFFYLMGFFFTLLCLLLSVRMIWFYMSQAYLPPINTLAVLFSFMSAALFTMFAMWFDMQENKHLP